LRLKNWGGTVSIEGKHEKGLPKGGLYVIGGRKMGEYEGLMKKEGQSIIGGESEFE